MLSDCLEEIEQLSLTTVKNIKRTNSVETEIGLTCSFSQQDQLQIYIDQLENMFNSNEVIHLNINITSQMKIISTFFLRINS